MKNTGDQLLNDCDESDAVTARISKVQILQRRCDQSRFVRKGAILLFLAAFVAAVVAHLRANFTNIGTERWLILGTCGIFIYGVSRAFRVNQLLTNEIQRLSADGDPRSLLYLLQLPIENWKGGYRDKCSTICAMMTRPGFVFPQPVTPDIRVSLRGVLRNVCKFASSDGDVSSAQGIIGILRTSQYDAGDLESFKTVGKYDMKNEHQAAIRELVVAAAMDMAEELAQAAPKHILLRASESKSEDLLMPAGSATEDDEADRTTLGRAVD